MSDASTGSAGAGLAAAIAAEGGDGQGAGGGEGAGGGAQKGAEGAADQGGGGAGAGGDPWYADLADEDDRKWVESKNIPDKAAAVKAYRLLETQYRSGDKIVLPKEGAPQEELDAFFTKIGRPEAPDKYEIKAPEGKQLDEALVGKFREAAFKAGLPATMAAPLVDMFNAHVTEVQEQQEAARVADRAAGIASAKKEWGAASPQNMAAANRAMAGLGLSGEDVDAIADAIPPELAEDGVTVKRNGTARTLELLRRLGAGMGEDVLSGGGGARKFGKSPAEARARLDLMANDQDLAKKIMDGDPTLIAERKALIEIVSAGQDAEDKN